jgi:hypothetical protein
VKLAQVECPGVGAVVTERLAGVGDNSKKEFRIVDMVTGATLFRYPYETPTVPRHSFAYREGHRCAQTAANEANNLVAWIEDHGRSKHFQLRVADCASGKLLADMQVTKIAGGGEIYESFGLGELKISPDGKRVAFVTRETYSTIGTADIESGEILWFIKVRSAGSIAFSPDSQSVYVIASTIVRRDCLTGSVISSAPAPVRTFKGSGGMGLPIKVDITPAVLNATLSPDGKFLAFDTSAMNGITICEMATGTEVDKIKVSAWPVEEALAFSRDSKGIWAAGAQDRHLRYFPISRQPADDEREKEADDTGG